MTQLDNLRNANLVRQQQWEGADAASDVSFRTIEFAGEAGEVCDAVKKLLRERLGIGGNRNNEDEILQAVKEEIGDAIISLDLLAHDLGIDINECIPMKFNKTSKKIGVAVYMDENWGVKSPS